MPKARKTDARSAGCPKADDRPGFWKPRLNPTFPRWARSTPETLLLGRSPVNSRTCPPDDIGWEELLDLGPAQASSDRHGLGPDQGPRARAAPALDLESRAGRGCRRCLNGVA